MPLPRSCRAHRPFATRCPHPAARPRGSRALRAACRSALRSSLRRTIAAPQIGAARLRSGRCSPPRWRSHSSPSIIRALPRMHFPEAPRKKQSLTLRAKNHPTTHIHTQARLRAQMKRCARRLHRVPNANNAGRYPPRCRAGEETHLKSHHLSTGTPTDTSVPFPLDTAASPPYPHPRMVVLLSGSHNQQ
jgi:hypothetical protein